MMRPLPSILLLVLLLCGCEKPEGSAERGTADSPAARGVQRGHAVREPVPGSPEALRATFVRATAYESASERERAFVEIAWNAIEIDPGLAAEALLQLPADHPEKLKLIQHHAMRLAERNPEEALAWAASVGSEKEVAAAIGQIALELAESDPSRAANLLSESGIAGRDFDVAVVQVIQRWSAISAPEAAAWVSLFPSGAARQAGIGVVAGRWLPSDPPATFAWFDSLKDPELRSEAARALEGVILQQPEDVRNRWIGHADDRIRQELEAQRGKAMMDVGDNIPAPQG